MKRLLVVLILIAPASHAQIVTNTSRGVVAAHDGRVELAGRWNVEGVDTATAIIVGPDRVAVLDALANQAMVIELADGRITRHETAETPIDGAFVGRDLYVLARDARVVQRIGGESIPVSADPAFLREWKGKLYVYSRATGAVEEIFGGRVARRLIVAPFASDFEISGNIGYVVFPRRAKVGTVDLTRMQSAGEIAVGAVPVDVAFAGGGSAITARILAVADPSAKRVWLTEGTQSTATAIARGFLRGFLGLGLFGARSSQFPTGIDRVLIEGKNWIAYDTSSGTLYRFTRKESSVIAKGIAPRAFAATANGVAYWHDGRVRMAR